jgi:hypothetical protein
VQVDCPLAGEKLPTPHAVQTVVPDDELNVPAEQGTQVGLAAPGVVSYVPGGQDWVWEDEGATDPASTAAMRLARFNSTVKLLFSKEGFTTASSAGTVAQKRNGASVPGWPGPAAARRATEPPPPRARPSSRLH